MQASFVLEQDNCPQFPTRMSSLGGGHEPKRAGGRRRIAVERNLALAYNTSISSLQGKVLTVGPIRTTALRHSHGSRPRTHRACGIQIDRLHVRSTRALISHGLDSEESQAAAT